VHHQGDIDQEGLNGDMKNGHGDPLNTKSFFFVEKMQHLFTFGNGHAREARVQDRHSLDLVIRPSQNYTRTLARARSSSAAKTYVKLRVKHAAFMAYECQMA
jgi:hypothetical protein